MHGSRCMGPKSSCKFFSLANVGKQTKALNLGVYLLSKMFRDYSFISLQVFLCWTSAQIEQFSATFCNWDLGRSFHKPSTRAAHQLFLKLILNRLVLTWTEILLKCISKKSTYMNRDFDKTSTLLAKKVWGLFVMDETAKSYLFALQM